MPNAQAMRGAVPSPRATLVAARQHRMLAGAPPSFILIPSFALSDWRNVQRPGIPGYGDCVTAEEAFAKTCGSPAVLLSRDEAINWASGHGYLNGANLTDVLGKMQTDGFNRGPIYWDDGSYTSVAWTNAAVLQSAIYQGPVKLGVSSNQLEAAWNSGNEANGWVGTNFHAGDPMDHCISLCGYGTIAWLAQQLGTPLPAGVNGNLPGYAAFTWGTIGILDVASMIAITSEAWLRQPTTVKRSALAGPGTLAFIKTANTPSGDVEVHLASGVSGYQERSLETATTFFNETDGVWQVLPTLDLVFIKTSNTPNGHVEVHIASRSSNYQQRALELATTFGNEADGTWQLLPNLDLAFIKTSNTPNSHVEVHIASRSSNYQQRTLEVATTFANEGDGYWQLLSNLDLVFIKTSNTPSGHVEVHIASRSSNYQQRTLELATTFADESDGVWQLLSNLDLAFIKTSNTPEGLVEVHIASRASNYQQRTFELGTTFANESDGTWNLIT
jgi:hypothetical protein